MGYADAFGRWCVEPDFLLNHNAGKRPQSGLVRVRIELLGSIHVVGDHLLDRQDERLDVMQCAVPSELRHDHLAIDLQ